MSLKSGGSLVFDQGEALTAIDVNTGKFVGSKGKTLEQTITQTNLEAAEEIAEQLRLRNLGGIIIIDFIDMDPRAQPAQGLPRGCKTRCAATVPRPTPPRSPRWVWSR